MPEKRATYSLRVRHFAHRRPARAGERGTSMSEAQKTAADAGTAQAGGSQSAGGSRTFTQDEVNKLIAKERRETEAKYEGFDQYKADSVELKELKQSQMTDLDKARSQLDEVTKERDALKSASERAAWVNEVASETLFNGFLRKACVDNRAKWS